MQPALNSIKKKKKERKLYGAYLKSPDTESIGKTFKNQQFPLECPPQFYVELKNNQLLPSALREQCTLLSLKFGRCGIK